MHPKNDVRKKIFVVATPITLSAMSWMVEIWTPEKHQKCDPQKGRGEPPSVNLKGEKYGYTKIIIFFPLY